MYVGLDISKKEIYVGSNLNKSTFKVENNEKGFSKLLEFINSLDSLEAVVMESSGGYEKAICYFLLENKIPFAVVNPKNVRRYADAMGILAKNDSIDAYVIACFAFAIKPKPVTLLDKDIVELKELVRRREQIIGHISSEKNRSYLTDANIKKSINRVIDFLEKELKIIEYEIDTLLKKRGDLSQKVKVIESIPGVGRVLSSTIIGFLPEIEQISKKQTSSLIGIAPFGKESGKVKKKGKIVGGRFQVRKALYMATISAIRFNKPIKEFYLKLKAKGKPGRVCIVACMNKLIRIIRACLVHNTLWEESYALKQGAA